MNMLNVPPVTAAQRLSTTLKQIEAGERESLFSGEFKADFCKHLMPGLSEF